MDLRNPSGWTPPQADACRASTMTMCFKNTLPRPAPISSARHSVCLRDGRPVRRLRISETASTPALQQSPPQDGGHHGTPTGFRTRSRSMWALDPHALSLGLVTVLRQWTCSLLCPVCTSQMYRYGSIPSHPPTCQGGLALGHARSRGETYMRPSSLASCMRRMRFLAAITAGVFEAPSSQTETAHETQPWPWPSLPPPMARPARFRSGMVQVIAPRESGEGWMCPRRRLVDRRCKAPGCPVTWDRPADGCVLCRCNVASIL